MVSERSSSREIRVVSFCSMIFYTGDLRSNKEQRFRFLENDMTQLIKRQLFITIIFDGPSTNCQHKKLFTLNGNFNKNNFLD